MEGNTVSLVIEELTNLKLGSLIRSIVPDPYSLIDRASYHKVLLDADVHALDSSGVERIDEILILLVVRGSLKVDSHFHDLIVFGSEHNAVVD